MHLILIVFFYTRTIFTIGYGDVTPKSDTGRMFIIFFMAGGAVRNLKIFFL